MSAGIAKVSGGRTRGALRTKADEVIQQKSARWSNIVGSLMARSYPKSIGMIPDILQDAYAITLRHIDRIDEAGLSDQVQDVGSVAYSSFRTAAENLCRNLTQRKTSTISMPSNDQEAAMVFDEPRRGYPADQLAILTLKQLARKYGDVPAEEEIFEREITDKSTALEWYLDKTSVARAMQDFV